MDQLKIKQSIRLQIQQETIGQAENHACFNAKTALLTSSVLGKVFRAFIRWKNKQLFIPKIK